MSIKWTKEDFLTPDGDLMDPADIALMVNEFVPTAAFPARDLPTRSYAAVHIPATLNMTDELSNYFMSTTAQLWSYELVPAAHDAITKFVSTYGLYPNHVLVGYNLALGLADQTVINTGLGPLKVIITEEKNQFSVGSDEGQFASRLTGMKFQADLK